MRHRATSFRNCWNRACRCSGGPLLPSLMSGVTVKLVLSTSQPTNLAASLPGGPAGPRSPCGPSFASDAALALTGHELPAVARTSAGIVLLGDERAAVEADEIEPLIANAVLIQAARIDRAAVVSRQREANPVGAARNLRSIFHSLEQSAVKQRTWAS
jgi:hypothetical protein